MVLSINLFNLPQNVKQEDYLSFVKTSMKQYSDYFNKLGYFFLGVYKPFLPERFSMSEVYLCNSKTAEEAKSTFLTLQAAPHYIQEIENKFEEFHGAKTSCLHLWVEPITLTLNSRKNLSIDGKMLRVCNFEPNPGKTIEQLVEFENRISDVYTSRLNTIEWNYMGTFNSIGFGKKIWAEVEFVKCKTPEEAIQKDKELGETPETTKIIQECATFIGKRNKDEMVWLLPLLLSEYSLNGIILDQ